MIDHKTFVIDPATCYNATLHMERQDLFQYTDYRRFLRDFVESRKRARPGWSYSVWARQLALKSPSTLIMLVNGQRHPGPKLVQRLNAHFAFNPEETKYFERLVQLHKVKGNVELSVAAMKELEAQHPEKGFKLIDHESFQAISNWHYYAIREMVNLKSFKEEPTWISKSLCFAISPTEASQAIEALIRIKLLGRTRSGKLVVMGGEAIGPFEGSAEANRRFHEQVLENARASIRAIDRAHREISGVTFSLKASDIPKAKEMIQKFQRQLCRAFDSPSADAIYHLETAFIPFTLPEESLK